MIHILIRESQKKATLMESAVLGSGELSKKEIKEAVQYITAHPDYTAYHLLFALRRQTDSMYKSIADSIRARILMDALVNLNYLNDWGYLDKDESFDGEAARAVLELNRTALPYLIPILDDEREAPLFGTEEATMSSIYKYRRKDFAYRYVSQILGLEPLFASDPKERDEIIESFRKSKEFQAFSQKSGSQNK